MGARELPRTYLYSTSLEANKASSLLLKSKVCLLRLPNQGVTGKGTGIISNGCRSVIFFNNCS
jgi:hypothetical protein